MNLLKPPNSAVSFQLDEGIDAFIDFLRNLKEDEKYEEEVNVAVCSL